MARTAILAVLILLAAPAYGQKPGPAVPSVSRFGSSRLRITHGAARAIVDLKADIAGCIGRLYDPTTKTSESSVPEIRIIDRVAGSGAFYLVVLAGANSNCNVQGHCGAASDFTLIWLKLDSNLRLVDKKAVVIQNCRASLNLAEPEIDDSGNLPLKLSAGGLRVKFTDEMDIDDSKHTVSELIYDRSFPEKGFVVTTSKKNR